jgi:hypothetical protein
MTARLVLPPGAKADEEQLLNIVANQLAIAVENARLYEGVVRHAAEQASLVEAGHLLASSLQVDEVLQRFTELARTRLSVDVVRIWLHEHGTEYRLAAQAGLAEKPGMARLQFAPGEGALGWIMEHLTPLMLPISGRSALPRARLGAAEGLVSFVGVPSCSTTFRSVASFAGRASAVSFNADNVGLAQARQSAAVGIRNARLHEETQLRLRHTKRSWP